MKKFIISLFLFGICTTAYALTSTQVDTKNMETSIDIIISQYQNAQANIKFLQTQSISYKDLLNSRGVNWPGFNWTTPVGVNWTQYGIGN